MDKQEHTDFVGQIRAAAYDNAGRIVIALAQAGSIKTAGEIIAALSEIGDAIAKVSFDINNIDPSEHSSGSDVDRPATAPSKAEIKKSIQPDHIRSFEDGRLYKSLKRHLTGRGLTPDDYRQKWGLPPDYPMVAPSYSAQRSALAKEFGLGKKPGGIA